MFVQTLAQDCIKTKEKVTTIVNKIHRIMDIKESRAKSESRDFLVGKKTL